MLYFQSHYALQARRSRSVTRKRKREASAPPTSKTRSQSASRPPRDQSGLRDVKVRDDAFITSSSISLFFYYLKIKIDCWRRVWCFLDGEEGEEDDEELPERHEPPGQERRVRQTRVRPQTQTPAVREEEVRHQRSQIKSGFFWTEIKQPNYISHILLAIIFLGWKQRLRNEMIRVRH